MVFGAGSRTSGLLLISQKESLLSHLQLMEERVMEPMMPLFLIFRPGHQRGMYLINGQAILTIITLQDFSSVPMENI
jgi:hypothetical protein